MQSYETSLHIQDTTSPEEEWDESVCVFPVSFAQQRLWFLHQFDPTSPVYNLPAALRLAGPLQVRILARSLDEIIERHETLRTTFVTIDGEPMQVIAPTSLTLLPLVDLEEIPAARREVEVRRLARAEARNPFDLSQGPLLRATLLRLNEREHMLVLNMHHIISDGWSMNVFIQELRTLYAAFCTGSSGDTSPLVELPIQYADFAVWQRQQLQGEALQKQLAYWKQQLAGAPAVLELLADRPRPTMRTFHGAYYPFALPPSLAQNLAELSLREGVTLFMTLLATFQVLLYRYTAQEDIVVGTPMAGRSRTELENLIGYFVNTLALRTDMSGDPGFRHFLGRVREVTLGAYAHQDLPFEQVVEALQPERNLSHNPLFQVMFALQNIPRSEMPASEFTMQPMAIENGTTKFDLTLLLAGDEHDLGGTLGYNTDLFEKETMARLVGHFQTLLESVVADPDRPISSLSMLTSTERSLLLSGLSPGPALPSICLHERFASQAARTPDALALVYEAEALTYGQLNARANQLAHALQARGVGPEVPVGLCLERSLDLFMGLLAVLKAGGVYVPLDPSYPGERLAFMLVDARIRVLLTHSTLRSQLPPATVETFYLDTAWVADLEAEEAPRAVGGAGLGEQPVSDPVSGTQPANAAYVIYTSGSTGQPKGVVVSHANVVRLFERSQSIFHFSQQDIWSLFHSVAFDFSVWELWGGLLYGGRVIVVSYEVSRSPQSFYALLRREGVTILSQTPSAFGQLQELVVEQDLALRLVIFGGEALEGGRLRSWFARHGDRQPQLVNMYGITETTVHVTLRELRVEDTQAGRGSRIGEPLPDLEVYILDKRGEPVPQSVAGELYVGGAGVARGYLGRLALTAERFVPHGWSRQPGARLYRTGDVARWRATGQGVGELEYLGRADQQVKVRGFRIEVGEIEAVLEEHPGVESSAVKVQGGVGEERRLAAYIVWKKGEARKVGELRLYVQGKLPEYMVPAVWVELEELARTPSGKVDRGALPEPEGNRPDLAQIYIEPRTNLERLLASMWCDMLGIERVGVYDNFFELGGDSIKGAIFINRLQEKLGEIIHIVIIFDAPTVAALAAYLSEHYAESVALLLGIRVEATRETGDRPVEHDRIIGAAQVAQIRQLIRALPPYEPRDETHTPKNRPAIFLLSPPRSGSTLLRVMLGGHPALFAPPELELLSFNTLKERKETFSGRDSFWLEGTLRAIMEIKGCDAQTAKSLMEEYEEQHLTTRQFYRLMQEWLGAQILVDKTPSYALDGEILKRAEQDFADARYIHLLRHPYGMISSLEEAKLDQIFFRYPHPFTRRELAELIWLVSQQNILAFLRDVPADRQHRVFFEELVRRPGPVLEELCRFLGLELHPDMLHPYKETRMTDGLYAESRMLGDVKFHEHRAIDSSVAERWRQRYAANFLGDITWQVAEDLGYRRFEGAGSLDHDKDAQKLSATPKAFLFIQPVPGREEINLPLSFAQQRLWFLDQLEPNSFAYNLPLALRFQGRLDTDALQRSLQEIVRRHEVLRTTFPTRDEQPVQCITPELTLDLLIEDLKHLPEPEREAAARHLAREDALSPFDMARGPLVRAKLLRLEMEDHVLLLNMHHIVSDGWSMGLFVREMSTLYTAFSSGQCSPLPELPIQYADFASWQRRWLTAELQPERSPLEVQLAYWRQQLAGVPAALNLPTDRPRPPVQTFRGAQRAFAFPPELLEGLKELAMSAGGRQGEAWQRDEQAHPQATTLFMTLLTAFAALLFRYSGQQDLVIGTPISGRVRAELEGLIGFFVNTLPLRVKLAGHLTFRELLGRVRRVAVEAYAHQEVPFEQVVDAVQPERDLSRNPLFQVMLAWQNLPGEARSLPGLTIQELGVKNETAKFDLTLFLWEDHGQLMGAAEYNTDLYEAMTIERLMSHYQRLLAGAVAHPDCSIARLPLLTETEQRCLLLEWNQPEKPVAARGDFASFTVCWAEQVARTPDSLALSCEGEQVTYQDLQDRVRRLAYYLQSEYGVGPEEGVALLFERGVSLVVAILAVFWAGGAYLPLDPLHPPARLCQILDQSSAGLLLVADELEGPLQQALASLSEERRPRVGLLSRLEKRVPLPWRPPVPAPLSAHHLAYVIYTSGSTGTPKGAMIEQGGMLNHLQAKRADLQLSAGDVVAQTATQCFDISVWQMLAALLVGGRVQILPDAVAHDPGLLLQETQRQAITILETVPSLLRAVLEEVERIQYEQRPTLRQLRWLMPTGEALPTELCRRWLHLYPAIPLINAYGPTECSDDVTHHPVTQPPLEPLGTPIGRPVCNTRLYVLDEDMQLAPPGISGELYVGGHGVGRGYLGEPDRSAQVFVPDPWSPTPGGRLYRTGDVVRYLPDGALEYRGRIDQQVKVRGYRIEPGEIESVLHQQAGIREAVVEVRPDERGETQLMAYLVLDTQQSAPLQKLRVALQERLPAYMLPSAFVILEQLPLTPGGKVDRRALSPPGEIHPEMAETYIAPRNPVEEIMAEIWADVLKCERVSIYDNFFEIGGHSLLATQVISRVRAAFHTELPLRSLFETPTIAGLADALVQKEIEEVDGETLAGMLADLEQLSADEVEAMLAAETESHEESKRYG